MIYKTHLKITSLLQLDISAEYQGGSVLNVASKRWNIWAFPHSGFLRQRGKPTTNVNTDTSQAGKLLQALHYVLGITSHFALEPEVRAENERSPKQNTHKKIHYRKVYKSILRKTTSPLRNSILCSGDMHWNG